MGTSSRILVVEDDPALSGLLRQQLEGDGFLVLMAETGEQAMQLAA
jgi:DNA-binding response OmpR family regulator